MAYHTAKNNTYTKKGNLIKTFPFRDKYFCVYENINRWYLYYGGYRLSEIIGGKEGFEKQYKGDFLKWASKVHTKDMNKVKKLREMAERVLKDAEEIETIWK